MHNLGWRGWFRMRMDIIQKRLLFSDFLWGWGWTGRPTYFLLLRDWLFISQTRELNKKLDDILGGAEGGTWW